MNRKDICKKCKEANHCCNDGADCADFDLTLFNQQDEKIQELEDKVFELNTKLNLKEHEPAFCKLAGKDCEFMGRIKKLDYENQKLFEDLYCEPNNKRLAIEELEKLRESVFGTKEPYKIFGTPSNQTTVLYLDQRIKELKGEN